MPDFLPFIGLALLFTFSWGRLLRFLDESSRLTTSLTFHLMAHSRCSFPQMKAVVLSAAYYGWCVVGSLLFAVIYRLDLSTVLQFEFRHLPLIFLGIAAEITLSNLLVTLYLATRRGGPEEVFVEIASIPWIAGIRRLPPRLLIAAPGISAICEEFFFRGILLPILLTRLQLAPWIAVALATVLFTVGQLLQVRTLPQAVVITCGSLAISLVGGLLVVQTGSVIPACLCHGSFVLFFMEYAGGNRSRSSAVSRSGEMLP